MRTVTPMVRTVLAIAACAAVAFASWALTPAHAQDTIGQRLSLDRLAAIQAGTYLAGDEVKFVLVPFQGDFVMRLADGPEIYVLYADNASLGGRILKYDTGETAMGVAVWGGMTLYTDAHPNGLPVERVGDAFPPSPPTIGPGEMQNQMVLASQHIFAARRLQIAFNVDWNRFGSPLARAYAFNAMQNAARGIERFATTPFGHDQLARRIDSVTVAPTGGRPDFSFNGRTLVVMFSSGRGFAGCASSREMAMWLAEAFGQKK